jgi:hypothetical protein
MARTVTPNVNPNHRIQATWQIKALAPERKNTATSAALWDRWILGGSGMEFRVMESPMLSF